ncbi:MAG: hypothetical protein CL878_14130 [Dehalococcoidia bacterium]|nr:hypothetical protein [Dehalococcoidia bacterium]
MAAPVRTTRTTGAHPWRSLVLDRTTIWNTFLVFPLINGLVFVTELTGSAGLAIIVFTVLIRLVLLPLSLKGSRSMKAMQSLQPKIADLKKRYGDDKQKVQEETMKLYKEQGVNPLGGCLPLLLQMPFFFAFYHALINLGGGEMAHEAFQAPFLWVADLSKPDVLRLSGLGFPIPFLLPLLAGGTQWVQQRMMTPRSDDPQQRLQQQMMQFMPLMIIVIGVNFGAGLALYWVVQNLFGIVQQYFVTGWGGLLPSKPEADTSTAIAVSRNTGSDGHAEPSEARSLDWRAGLRRLLGTSEPDSGSEVVESQNGPIEKPRERRRSSRRRGGRRARGKR